MFLILPFLSLLVCRLCISFLSYDTVQFLQGLRVVPGCEVNTPPPSSRESNSRADPPVDRLTRSWRRVLGSLTRLAAAVCVPQPTPAQMH